MIYEWLYFANKCIQTRAKTLLSSFTFSWCGGVCAVLQHQDCSNASCCVQSWCWPTDLQEAQTIFAVFQIHPFWVEVVRRPAERQRLGILEGQIDGPAAIIGVLIVRPAPRFVARGAGVSRCEDGLSGRIGPVVWDPGRSLRYRKVICVQKHSNV